MVGNRAITRSLERRRSSPPDGPELIQRYRRKGSYAYGEADDLTSYREEPFRNARTQPWIRLIRIVFDRVENDANGEPIPKGSLTATYHSNAAAPSPISFPVSGGPAHMITDKGSFTVHRIEGLGYNDPGAAAEKADEGIKLEGPKRGKHRRYSPMENGERGSASMNLAVFYNRGEAIHHGLLDQGSHGCVHVEDWPGITQVNLHSVIGRTRVNVVYSGKAAETFYPGSVSDEGAEPAIDVARAVRLNRVYEKRLADRDWPGALPLRTLWWMGFERMFAWAVADWQRTNMPGEPDGILGPKTLSALQRGS